MHTVKVIDNSGTDEPTSASITIIVRGRAEYELIINLADFFCLKVNSFRRSHESPAISLRRGILREFLLFFFRPDTLSRFDSLIGSSFSFCSCVYVIPALAFFIVFSPLLELNK